MSTDAFTLIGITVSYQYDDYLRVCLSNAKQLDHWYVVVHEADTPTLELLRDIPNVTLVYFDFHAGNCTFNKTGGIRKAQQIVHEKYPNAWVLLLDSDIVLPDNARAFLTETTLDPTRIYGAQRAFYYTYDELARDQPRRTVTRGIWGYFHLYFDKKRLCIERFRNASRYDDAFLASFGPNMGVMLPLVVKHLGDERCNWDGRKSERFIPPSEAEASTDQTAP